MAGALRSDRVVLSRPSSLIRPHPTPCRLDATSRFSGYTHRLLPASEVPGPTRASPVLVPTFRPSRSPYPGGFLGACNSRSSTPSMGLRRAFSGSAPPCPLAGLASRGCKIRLMLRAGRSLPQKGFRRWASTPGVSPRRRQPATGPPGSYPDRTLTGRQTRACRRGSPQLHHLLPEMARCPRLLGTRRSR
jgi:hypothetical protein